MLGRSLISRPVRFNSHHIIVTYKWFAIATILTLMALGIKQAPYPFVILLAVYTGIFSFLVLIRCSIGLKHKLLLLGVDFAICILLLFFSGGWASPFFQYGLSFLILAAMLFGFRGAALSIAFYGAFYFIVLYLNGFSLDKIIAKGYFESLIVDYAIFVFIGFASASIFQILDGLSMRDLVQEDYASEENPIPEQLGSTLSFTPQEARIANLLVDELTNEQIASKLGISINTVKYHIKNIYRKLDVNCRSKALLKLMDYSMPPDSIINPKD